VTTALAAAARRVELGQHRQHEIEAQASGGTLRDSEQGRFGFGRATVTRVRQAVG
jgi:hypothetical protein